MQMSVGEIKRSYDEAKHKQRQIGILAELNNCTKEDIIKIINIENKSNNTVPESVKVVSEELTLSQINNMLYARLDEIEGDIKKLEEEYRKIFIAVEVLGNMKEVRQN